MVVSIAARIAARKLAQKLARLANKRRDRASLTKVHKKVPLRVSSAKQIKTFKQKPKHLGGGPAPITSRGYTGDYKVGPHAKRAIWHDTRARGSESWRSEMTRYFGGLETGSRSVKRLHKSYAKDIRKLRKKLKTKFSVGGLVIGKNVDLSLL